jgi:hypothetical protein
MSNTKCVRCGVETGAQLASWETATCWDCATLEHPELESVRGLIEEEFKKHTERYINVDGSWQQEQ